MESPTLRDQLDFDALPEEIKIIARKVLDPTARQLEDAKSAGYFAGLGDGRRECEETIRSIA